MYIIYYAISGEKPIVTYLLDLKYKPLLLLLLLLLLYPFSNHRTSKKLQ